MAGGEGKTVSERRPWRRKKARWQRFPASRADSFEEDGEGEAAELLVPSDSCGGAQNGGYPTVMAAAGSVELTEETAREEEESERGESMASVLIPSRTVARRRASPQRDRRPGELHRAASVGRKKTRGAFAKRPLGFPKNK
jgi:hypothetical protein